MIKNFNKLFMTNYQLFRKFKLLGKVNRSRVKKSFELMSTCSDIMLNHQFSQKLKLFGNGEFNCLTVILIVSMLTFPW
jgi:hypothetical protein